MIHPHDEDADEARHKSEERRPLLDEAFGERHPAPGGIAEVQREQCDRECEHAIAERLHPDGFLFLESFAVHHAPGFGDGTEVMYKSVADLGDLKMAKNTPLTRDLIVRALTSELQRLPSVHAFWEAGAAAFNRIDEWSDIDLYSVVDDAAVPQTFEIVEKTLSGLSPIRLKHAVSWPDASGIHQKFYHLEGTSEYLLVDLAVMTLSEPDKFLVREIHGEAVFFFNQEGRIVIPPLDTEAFVRGLLGRRRRLAERMELFGPFVPKE